MRLEILLFIVLHCLHCLPFSYCYSTHCCYISALVTEQAAFEPFYFGEMRQDATETSTGDCLAEVLTLANLRAHYLEQRA